MSLATVSRCRMPYIRCSSRLVAAQSTRRSSTASTAATPKAKHQSQHTLPPAKMRALISLYHQSESWITPENLLERIDAAFAPPTNTYVVPKPEGEGVSLELLEGLSQRMRIEPKMSQLESDPTSRRLPDPNSQGMWSNGRDLSRRETKVFEALYGVEVEQGPDGIKVLPGVEVLEEMKDKLARDRMEDKETQRLENA